MRRGFFIKNIIPNLERSWGLYSIKRFSKCLTIKIIVGKLMGLPTSLMNYFMITSLYVHY